MHTIDELNKKTWYRFLKVLYLLVLAVVISVTVLTSWNDYTSYLAFDPTTFGAIQVSYPVGQAPWETNKQPTQLVDYNALAKKYGAIDSQPMGVQPTVPTNGHMKLFGEIVPALLVELLLFEIIRRSFYYIVIGRVFPKRNLSAK